MIANVTRRDFVRSTAAATAGIAAATALSGAAVQTAQADEAGAPASYTPGTYTATTRGNGGDVTVTVEVSEDSILQVAAEGENETAGIGTVAMQDVPAAIVEANSVDVDGVAGATVTSDAVKRAVSACLRGARGRRARRWPTAAT